VIVVDHASTDASLALLRQWRGRLDLQVLALDHNGSFSASSNLGASRARGQYVLFMNNDIIWLQDALPRLLESLHNPQVGVVGIKLLKVVGESRAGGQFASEVQHLGVRFKLNHLGYWPYEVEPSAPHDEAEHAPQCVPAVTGAVLLCRKSDFDAVGGFDPAYFYGFEDVELCLRLAYRLGKTVVCRNDSVALHHHGHTRLSGREMSIYDRVMRNSAVLESHIGVWIKQAYWRSLVNGRRLHHARAAHHRHGGGQPRAQHPAVARRAGAGRAAAHRAAARAGAPAAARPRLEKRRRPACAAGGRPAL
jgi:GT2 family glycosyltransferase